jgi:hypothetical protein
MSAMAIYRQVRRLPAGWTLGYLPVCRQSVRNRVIWIAATVCVLRQLDTNEVGFPLNGCRKRGLDALSLDRDLAVRLGDLRVS